MLNSRDTHFTLDYIISQICKEGFCNRPQLLYAVWEATKKVITNNWSQGRETTLSNVFIARGNRQFNKYYFYLEPTEVLLSDCALKYRAESVETTQPPTPVGETNLYKNLNSTEKEYFKNGKELIGRFFYLIVGKIKEILKAHRNLEIFFQHFGIIRVNEKTYFFQSFKFNDKGSLSSPNLHKYKRFSSSKKDNLTSERSGDESKINSRILDAQSSEMKRSFNLRKRPYFHEAIVQNEPPSVKICNDLLGAGIDPLTYDYSYSKLTDHSPELLATQFKRQEHAQGRLPCVIDKFARTKGSQLTGIKVGNSIIVRIGSNYSPTARNYYLDITSKSIQFITPEVKIKLENPRQKAIQPATDTEEYEFVIGTNRQLESRVQLRKEMYQRYCQYYKEIIPNDCVAHIKQQAIQRIVKQVKVLVRKLGRKDGSPLINSLMNEVNTEYYMAYKKAVLNYILRDKEEMLRIGISITFNCQTQWGKPIHRKLLLQNLSVNITEAKAILQLNHILYPQCLNKIYQENEKLVSLQIFKKRKEGQYRPYNILYYIKRNVNQLNEAYTFLCDNWVKRISVLIQEYINLKQQNYQKLKQFFNSIHIVMSNKLKQLLYVTLENISQQFSKFEGINQQQSKNLLMINMTEEGEKITFIDDIQKVFKFELTDIVDKIIEVTRRIPRVQNCLKLSTELFIWGIDIKDSLLARTKRRIRDIIQQNYLKILQLRQRLSGLEAIFKLKEQIIQWCKQSYKIDELKGKLGEIDLLERQIMKVNCYYKVSMVVVDCIELKRKLLLHLKSLRKLLFDSVEERVKQKNSVILTKINANIQLVSKSVSSTTQFVSLAQDIQHIKSKEMGSIRFEIDSSFKDVMSLFPLEGFTANYEVMKSTYICRQSFEDLHYQLYKNERRLTEERGELEKRLREKINQFQTQTLTWLKEINSKIETFDMRKLYSEYLAVLVDYQSKVQSNRQVQKILNCQQQDLKWATTTFNHAIELENIVEPNYQLWQLVSQYDSCIKQWKYIELSHFDIENSEIKVTNIDNRITRLITKLKNFAGLKIVYDLQNDVKEFLVQQVPIIKIFSNPGLKDRHWSLFNKRLPLPGYDLKQLTYGRIKLLYQYEKNLKVLMSISNQAAKEFEIENEKQEMFDYWSRLNFSLYHANDENIIFINQAFLDEQIQVIQHHLTKTVILKNSPFSKALVQMLSEWQGWLINGRKILTGFRASQQKFMIVRSIFKMDEINKILPIESTEYDSIENIWKSVIKKILQQPKVTQFFKSQKMPEIIEQIGKKADFIRNSFNTYLNLKRLEFDRLYFLPQKIVLNLIQFLASDRLQDAYSLILQKCFIGINSMSRDDFSSFHLTSRVDTLQVMCETFHAKKGKSKFFEELVILEKNMRQNIKKEIKEISYIRQTIQEVFDVYTITAVFMHLELQLGSKIQKKQKIEEVKEYFRDLQYILTVKIKEFPCLKYQNLLSKVLFLKWRCEDLQRMQNPSPQSILHFVQTQEDYELKIYNNGIKFQFQYLGDEVPCYIPTDSDKLVWHIAFSMSNKVGIICEKSNMLRQLALWTGQYFVYINNPLHSIESNFESCIMGIVSTSYWIHFLDDYIKVSASLLNILTHIYQQKKQKIAKQQSTLFFRNNQLTINPDTCLFLSINKQRCKSIPDGLLTCMRSITIARPSSEKIQEYLRLSREFERLKIYLFANKLECSALKPNEILKEIQHLGKWSEMKAVVKNRLWKFLNVDQRAGFVQLFQQRSQPEEIEYKNWQHFVEAKQEEVRLGLTRHSIVIVTGKQGCKSTVILNVLKKRHVEALFDENRGVNLNFIENGVSELNLVKYLEKSRQKIIKENDEIIIYIDCDLSMGHLQAIQAFEHIHSLSAEHKKPMKIIAESCSIESLDPRSLVSFAIINFNQNNLDNASVYQYWANKLDLNAEDKANVLELEMNFENMIGVILKMQKRAFSDSKQVLTKRFFNYFTIYLTHLNSKQVERMCQFDKQNYIFNSFIYCAFWAFGGSLRSMQAEVLKKYIRETYSQKLDIPGELDEIYLNEDNEWVYWQSLKQDFVSEKENIPLYQIWVPTANNTKILTILIKLLENNHSILLSGTQSGRSSIMAEISSFQLSYNTFLLDCHRKTSINHITSLTRGRIIYGDFKKNLILVDDLHLPPQEACDILRTFMEWGYCSNSSLLGKLNEDIFKPLVVATWQGSQDNNRCFWRFYEKMIPIQLQKLGEGELENVFRTYFNSLLVSNQVDNNLLKLENIIVNFCMHTLKVFPSISISNIRLLVESVCRFNLNKDETTVLQHLLSESQSILQVKLPSHEITHFFRHMSYYYGKLLSIQLKNHNQLKEVAQAYLYDVRPSKQTDKKQTFEELNNWMHQCISDKSGQFFISNFHVKILQKILWSIKGNNSHIVLLSAMKNGCHSLAKISGWLLKIGTIELQQFGVNGLLEQVVKVLKTGGKVDECLSILTYDLLNAKPELVKLVNSLMFSPEFHECFGQILMEQIIKSFNSEKKFLKKNVKKSELIKKIRQKFNGIFHFCLCLTKSSFENLLKQYPRFGYLRLIEVQEWPSEALTIVSKKFVSNQSDEVLRVILRVEQQIKSNWQICGGKNSCRGALKILSIFDKIVKFMEQKAKSQQESTQLWSKRIRMSQQKLQNLHKQKKLFQSQHNDYFLKIANFSQQIADTSQQYESGREKHSQMQLEVEKCKDECNMLKNEFQKTQTEVHLDYFDYIEAIKTKLTLESHRYKQNEKIDMISLAYEFPTDNIEHQLVQFLLELEKDYFHKLLELDYSDLGLITNVIDKFKGRMEDLWGQQCALSFKFKQYENMHINQSQFAYKVKELEDKVSILRDDETELKENQEATIKAYQDLKEKISQIESINSILLKFEHVLRSKNQLAIPVPKNVNGCAILVSFLLAYSLFLSFDQAGLFVKMVTSKLEQHKFQASIRQLLSFYTYELQFKMLYQYQAKIEEVVNSFGLQSSDIACVAIGGTEEVVDWLGRVTESRHIIWMKDGEDIKQLLQRDQIILIKYPNSSLLQKLSTILSRPFITRNNTKILVVEEEELTIHENSKCIFIFDNSQDIPEELAIHNLFAFKVYQNTEDRVLQFIEKKMNEEGLMGSRCELVSNYLKGCRQISMMDEKLHSIIMKMKKQNIVSEIIYKKIEEQGENKLENERKLQQYKLEISDISRTMIDYRMLSKDISTIYSKFKSLIAFKQFREIMTSVGSKISIQNIHQMAAKMYCYLQTLLSKQGQSNKIKQIEKYQFQDTTVKIIQRSSILVISPDISLAHRYVKAIMTKISTPMLNIAPEDLSINNVKEANIYICLVNRQEQLKQTLTLVDSHKEKFSTFKIIYIILDSLKIPPQIVLGVNSLTVRRVGELMMDLDQSQIGLIMVNSLKLKQDKTLYQQQLEYRSYLSELKTSRQAGRQMKELLEIEL